MKKFNLFFSILIVALVLLVLGGATITPAVQMRSMTLNAASAGNLKGMILFDQKGRYALDRSDLGVGKTYQFFGYDWRLVLVEGNTATFWMADPYTKTRFNHIDRSATGINPDGSNIWTNGYSKTVWKKTTETQLDLGQSDVREFLYNEAKRIIDNKAYAAYKEKVVPGYVDGHNQATSDTNSTQCEIDHLSFGEYSIDDVTMKSDVTKEIVAQYGLDTSDRLWLPSIGDFQVWNVLNSEKEVIKPNTLRWTETTKSGYYAWLRNPDQDSSEYAMVISPEAYQGEGDSYATYFHAQFVNDEAGVRPAIHLDITQISTEYEAHLNDSNRKNWLDDDWLKAMFLTVCVIGVVGLVLVIVAVIAKARRAKKA